MRATAFVKLACLQYSSEQQQKEDLYQYRPIPMIKRFKRLFRKMDFFSTPITLQYKGEKYAASSAKSLYRKFYTNFGALTSLIIIIVMTALTGQQFSIMFAYQSISFQETSQLSAPTRFILGHNNSFTFAYRVRSLETGRDFDFTQYLHIDIRQYTQSWVQDDKDPINKSRLIETSKCIGEDFEKFPGLSRKQIQRMQLNNFTCPSNKTFTLFGGNVDNEYTYIHMAVSKCTSANAKDLGIVCKSDTEINEMIGKLEVEFVFLNANFDQLDLYQPVKIYVDDRLREGLIPGYIKNHEIYLTNNTATLYDDYFKIKGPTQIQFYSVKAIEKYISISNPNGEGLVTYTLKASSQSSKYERRVFSIFDISAQIGGIMRTLMLFGLVFCALFEHNLFLSSLIRKLYHFPAKFKAELKDLRKKKKLAKKLSKKNDERKFSEITDRSSNAGAGAASDVYVETAHSNEPYHQSVEKIRREQHLGVKEIKDELNILIGRKSAADFNLKTLGILKHIICCCRLYRMSKSLRETPSKRQALFFQKGQDRLWKELDVATIVKQNRRIKYLMKILLDKDQRRLLKLKQAEFIDSEEEEHPPGSFKKSLKKSQLVNLYVDSLRAKKLKRSDIKLLSVMGFQRVLELHNKHQALSNIQAQWGIKPQATNAIESKRSQDEHEDDDHGGDDEEKKISVKEAIDTQASKRSQASSGMQTVLKATYMKRNEFSPNRLQRFKDQSQYDLGYNPSIQSLHNNTSLNSLLKSTLRKRSRNEEVSLKRQMLEDQSQDEGSFKMNRNQLSLTNLYFQQQQLQLQRLQQQNQQSPLKTQILPSLEPMSSGSPSRNGGRQLQPSAPSSSENPSKGSKIPETKVREVSNGKPEAYQSRGRRELSRNKDIQGSRAESNFSEAAGSLTKRGTRANRYIMTQQQVQQPQLSQQQQLQQQQQQNNTSLTEEALGSLRKLNGKQEQLQRLIDNGLLNNNQFLEDYEQQKKKKYQAYKSKKYETQQMYKR